MIYTSVKTNNNMINGEIPLFGQVDFIKPPPDEQIVGVVCVLQDFTTGKVFLARELRQKPEYDKVIHDYTPPAGGRDFMSNGYPPEDLFSETLPREMMEETGYMPDDYVVDPIPIGWFQFTGQKGKPWIVAYRAFIEHEKRLRKFAMPYDYETAFPIWVDPKKLDLNTLPLRGGIREILAAHCNGERNVIREISAAKHLGYLEVVDPFPPALIVDANGTRRVLEWNREAVVGFLE